jgi:aldose 1-epimerase
MMRPATAADIASGDPARLASFPLLPFSNRIAHGRFTWAGRDYQLPIGIGEPNHAHHGLGWRRPWIVAETAASAALLRLDYAPVGDGRPEWPFAFRAEQRFTLGHDMLTLALCLENRASETAPVGLGHHPYFLCDATTWLAFRARAVWENGALMLPVRRTAVPEAWDHSAGRPLDGPTIDNCFAGWDGRARIEWPDRGVALDIAADPPPGHLVVYAPQAADFLAVEPVSHMNDALNHQGVDGHGMIALPAGATLATTTRLRRLALPRETR